MDILYNNENEQPTPAFTMDEVQNIKHNVEQKKSDTKECILCFYLYKEQKCVVIIY